MTTTDQQAVTVAQIDRDAAALIFPTHAMTIMSGGLDETENVQVFARHRLASVSSASAEGSEDARKYLASRCDAAEQSGDRAISVNIAVLRVAFPDPMHADQVAARSRALVERIAKADPREGNAIIYDGEIAGEWEHEARVILALTASPEPVPATNQAGEVERLRAAFAAVEQHFTDFEDCDYNPDVADVQSRAREGLALIRSHMAGVRGAAEDVCHSAVDDCTDGRKVFVDPDAFDRLNAALGDEDYTTALATQPATSQEGEAVATAKARLSIATAKARNRGAERGAVEVIADDVAVLLAAHSDLDRQLSAATPTPPTLSEDLRSVAEKFERGVVWAAGEAVPVERWKIAVSCGDMRDRFPCVRCGAKGFNKCRSGLTLAEINATRDFINGYGWDAAFALAQVKAS